MKPHRILPSLGLALAFALPLGAVAGGVFGSAGAQTMSKARLGVHLKYTLAPVSVGSASVLEVETAGPASGSGATITFRPDAGLSLASNDGAVGEPQPIGGARRFSLVVTPQREGLFYVNVFLRSGQRSEATAIPVQVGAVSSTGREVKLQVSPAGERVISIPAQQK